MPIRRQFVYERHPVREAPHRRRMQAAAGRAEQAEQAEKTEYDGHNEQLRPAPDNPDKLDNPDKKPDAAQCGIRPYHIPKNY